MNHATTSVGNSTSSSISNSISNCSAKHGGTNTMSAATILTAVIALVVFPQLSAAQERQIRVSVTVAAKPEQVWALWTTNEGVRSFFAPGSNIDLKVDGAYEIFFNPAAPAGKRGADGMRLLAVEPNKRLAFTWNAPPTLSTRGQRTMVSIDLTPIGGDSTRVVLRHFGWGSGPDWDATVAYFEQAWNAVVLPRLRHRIEHGPINWSAPPSVAPVHERAIEVLIATARG